MRDAQEAKSRKVPYFEVRLAPWTAAKWKKDTKKGDADNGNADVLEEFEN